MSSANGYVLRVIVGQRTHEVRASWPAPYFVLDHDLFDPEIVPALIHCDSIEHARRHAKLGGTVLDAKFEPVR
jgi:hypothetical protein